MQSASQCVRHLNRAHRGRWQPHRGLDATRRAASSRTPRTNLRSSGPHRNPPAAESRASDHLRAGHFPQPGVGPDAPDYTRSNASTAARPRAPLHSLRVPPANRAQDRQSLQSWGGPGLESQLDAQTNDCQTNDWPLREVDTRLADIPGNENDSSVWLGLLNAAKREHGRDGVRAIWDAVERRRTLYEVNSEGAESFWRTVLEAVLHDEGRLRRVVSYAEWMLKAHAVQWPSLYRATVSYFLRDGQHRRAMQWHLRLMPKFEPGPEAFGALLREFVASPEADLQQTLKSLYITTLHRNMYDALIPFLYESGLSQLCAEWRSLLIKYHDLPQPTAKSRAYLRFLIRYYPGTPLELEEQLVVDLNSPAYWDVRHDSLWDAMNGTHGEDNGPSGRRYSDTLGARWFASSWVPLDFAIHAVHALGVRQIGPLSLQSIALREPTPEAVVARIEQLHRVDIGIGHSTYARAVRHFAENEDGELLSELLHTDIHPDVFDDPAMQQSIRDKALEAGAWRTYRLLLAIQPAMAQQSIESTSNLLLQQQLKQRQTTQALALIDDMRSMNIDISATSLQHISFHVLDPLPWSPKIDRANWESLKTGIAYLNRLALLQKPVPSKYWQKVLFGLGKFGRLQELEAQCLGILDAYQARCASEGGLLPVHPMDAPSSSVGGLAENVLVPADLPIAHDHHPMRKIFNMTALHVAIVRWGFKAGISAEEAPWVRPSGRVQDAPALAATRGVRLLAMLQERGIPFETDAVQEEVVRCLVHLYPLQRKKASLTNQALPQLAVVRGLINKAAGRRVLPPVVHLRDLMAGAVGKHGRHRK